VILDFLAADALPPLARSILPIHPSVCVCPWQVGGAVQKQW